MKHVMLLFLSEMHLDRETNAPQFAHYTSPKGDEITSAQTNETAVRYVMESLGRGETLDAVFYFATSKVKENLSVRQEDGTFLEMTHEACFIEPLLRSYPELAGKFISVTFDEAKSAKESLRTVADMAEKVREKADNETVIDVDMTGGFRYASMMMLSVLQLLERGGFLVGHVLYTNFGKKKIEDVSEIYKSFTLVSGAAEFANFGSVKELTNYFKGRRKKGSALAELFDEMENLVDAFNICQPSRISQSLQVMNAKIKAFKDVKKKTPRGALFSQVLSIIEKEYGGILGNDVSHIDIIRWCIKKNFIQQAITLCTEWIPHEIITRKIFYTDSSWIKKHGEQNGEKMHRDWEQDFIIAYTGRAKSEAVVRKKKPRNLISVALKNYHEHRANESFSLFSEETKKALSEFFDEIDGHSNFLECLDKTPHVEKAVKILHNRNTGATYKGEFPSYVQSLSEKKFWNQLYLLTEHEYREIFGLNNADPILEMPNTQSATISAKISNQEKVAWSNKEKQYTSMIGAGEAKSDYPEAYYLSVLKSYFFIRNQRNQINHANESVSFDGNNIKKKMMDCLDKIDHCKCIKKV